MPGKSRTKKMHRSGVSTAREVSSIPAARWWAKWWLPVLLAVVAFLVYGPSLSSGFVSDARTEIDEGFVTSLSNLPKVLTLKVLGMNLLLSDRPGEILYLMLNAAVWGRNPMGFHLDSMLLHAANVALVFTLMGRLLLAEGGSRGGVKAGPLVWALAAGTLVFALHPIAVESVAEVSMSSSLLVAFYTLAALLAATFFEGEGGGWRIVVMGGFGVVCAAAAVLTKESGIAVAPVLIVYWFLFRRGEARRPWLAFLGLAVTITVLTVAAILFFAIPRQMKLGYLGGSFGQVFLIQPQLWVYMMGQLLWPTKLAADYTLADMALPSTPVAFGVLGVVVALQVGLARKSRIGAVGVATYWLGLAAVSNLIPLYCILADRFYYLPLAGVAMQLVGGLSLLMRWPWVYRVALGMVLGALPFLAVLTVEREAVFASEDSLWEDTIAKSPHSSLGHFNLGLNRFREGRFDEATREFEESLALDPTLSNACLWLGLIDREKGGHDAAMAEFRRALEINPGNGDAHCYLGIELCGAGRLDEGVRQLREALAIDPDNDDAHTNLGMALAQEGQVDQAMKEYERALAIDPDSAQAHYQLGNAWMRAGKPDRAKGQFEKTLELKPGDFEARMNLGVIFLHQGNFDEAIAQFREAVGNRPDSVDARNDLGVALIQKGDVAGAMAQFQEALAIDPENETARINLEKAQAAARP